MINFKQKELIRYLLNAVREKFPEVRFLRITESPEDPADLWVNITSPEDEDRKIELIEFASARTTDILLDYGYHISVMPRNNLVEFDFSGHIFTLSCYPNLPRSTL